MYKAIVIDDEESARESIGLLIDKNCPDVKLSGKANSVDAGIKLIQKEQPQIIFLDINMPGKTGLELFDYIPPRTYQVIFTTAYDEYALKAINLSACYYLLKPISPSEFIKAVNLATENIKQGFSLGENLLLLKELINKSAKYPEKMIINSKNGYQLILVNEIMYLEGDKNYTWIHTKDNKYLSAKTMKEYEDVLDPEKFYRVHQSYIVQKAFVKSVLNTKPDQVELVNTTLLSVARDRKKNFLDWLVR